MFGTYFLAGFSTGIIVTLGSLFLYFASEHFDDDDLS